MGSGRASNFTARWQKPLALRGWKMLHKLVARYFQWQRHFEQKVAVDEPDAISLAYVKHGGTELLSATSVEAAPEHRDVFGGSHHISAGASSCTHMSFSDVHASSLIFFFNIYTTTTLA
ncbi:hypothetical protein TRVL_06249 [Trypanosoma vivax]|nr:hypothetical protein TRVL_06249 [Trypanosoma vivax]